MMDDADPVEPVDEAEHAGEPEERLPEVTIEEGVRIVEALLFATDGPLPKALLNDHVGAALSDVMDHLRQRYDRSGIVLMEIAGGYALRTAPDLGYLFEEKSVEPKKLSRAALETLAIIAYHQPVTRAEIEDIRGVSASKGTLDVLLELGWVRMRGRRRTPGRPVTYGTTPSFLDQFTLATIGDLPGLDELKGAGLLEAIPKGADQTLPMFDPDQLAPDEDPLEPTDGSEERAAMSLWPDGEEPGGDDQSTTQSGGESVS